MKDAVDIYGRFLIAIFSFVAPAMTLLIGLFGIGIAKYRTQNEKIAKELENFIMDISPKDMPGADSQTKIKAYEDNLRRNKDQQKKAARNTRLLSPKRQLRRIFIPLLLSTIFLIVYHLTKPNDLIPSIKTIPFLCLFVSLTLLVYGLVAVWQVFCKIIDVRAAMEKDSRDEKNGGNDIRPEQ